MNAFAFARKDAEVGFSLNHNADATEEEMVAFVLDLRARLSSKESDGRIIEFLETIARLRVDQEQRDSIINAAFPEPTAPKDMSLGKANGIEEVINSMRSEDAHKAILDSMNDKGRSHAKKLARMAIDRENVLRELNTYARQGRPFSDTAYAVYQAVSEYATHRTGRGDVGASVLLGARNAEIVRAAVACQELV